MITGGNVVEEKIKLLQDSFKKLIDVMGPLLFLIRLEQQVGSEEFIKTAKSETLEVFICIARAKHGCTIVKLFSGVFTESELKNKSIDRMIYEFLDLLEKRRVGMELELVSRYI